MNSQQEECLLVSAIRAGERLATFTLLLSLGRLMLHVAPGLLMLLAVPLALYVLLSLKEHNSIRPDASFQGDGKGDV